MKSINIVVSNLLIAFLLMSCAGKSGNIQEEYSLESISKNTKRHTEQSYTYIESPKFSIDGSKSNFYSIIEHKDKNGTRIFKAIYTYIGIRTHSVKVNGKPTRKDLIFQDSANGRLLEVMTVEIDDSLMRSHDDINISVTGRGIGSIETLHGFAKYSTNDFSFTIPNVVLRGFINKADSLSID